MNDIRYAIRMLRRQPGFALVALLTLAIGIGANGAMFSLIEAALLRPLHFPHPDRIMLLFGSDAAAKRTTISIADLEDWRKCGAFSTIAAMQGQSVSLTGIDQPARLAGGFVSSDYFSVLGAQPHLGRLFQPADDQPGAERVALLSYELWQSRFGGDAGIVGRSLILNGQPFVVAGVLPASFQTPYFSADIWLPVDQYPNYSRSRAQASVIALSRLADGVSLKQAQVLLDATNRQLSRAYPDTNRDRGGVVIPFQKFIGQNVRPSLLALSAAAGCILLIACANISGLLLAKSAGRRQEMAVRAGLGASRARLVSQLLTESVILALGGALLGTAFAYGLARWLVLHTPDWPNGIDAGLNWPVIAFLVAASLLAGVLLGLAPALMAKRAADFRWRGADRSRSGTRSVLVIAQIAVAFILLVCSGLLMASLRRMLNIDVGFEGRHVLSLEYRLPRNKYSQGAQQTQFHNQVVSRIRALPGVEAAAIIRGLPFSGNGGSVEFTLPDRPAPPRNAPWQALYNAVTPGCFDTLRIPLRAGRDFRESDRAGAARVIVVSDAFARRFWPGQNAVGRQVWMPDRDLPPDKAALVGATIVGIAGDIRHDRLEETELPQIYVPYAQDPFIFATLVVRTGGDPMAHVKDVQKAVWSIDKDQPMWKIRTPASLVELSMGPRKLLATLIGAFSAIAVILAALGLFGLISYQVGQRSGEIGIRMALGAAPRTVVGMILRSALLLVVIGIGIGAAASPALVPLIRHELFGVAAADPGIYAILAILLVGVSLLASAVPAWRAARIDPAQALRSE